MSYVLLKLFLSAAIIVAVTEIAKANATLGGLIKSLPLVSLLAFLWLYWETGDVARISALSISTFWFVLPTLPLFLVLPALLRRGLGFYPALTVSLIVMLLCYGVTVAVLRRFGLRL